MQNKAARETGLPLLLLVRIGVLINPQKLRSKASFYGRDGVGSGRAASGCKSTSADTMGDVCEVRGDFVRSKAAKLSLDREALGWGVPIDFRSDAKYAQLLKPSAT